MKKKITTVLSILLLMLLTATTAFSQTAEYYQSLKDKSDLVIERRITKSIGKWNQERSMIFTEHEILVSKVFAGELRNNKIELITPGGISEGHFMSGSHLLDLESGMEGVFFVQDHIPDEIKSDIVNDQSYFANQLGSYYPKNYTEGLHPLGYGARKSRYNYERFLASLGDPIQKFTQEEIQNLAIDCSELVEETLAEVSFRNIEITEGFQNIEFDVLIQTNPEGLNLGKCEYNIGFPSGVFGDFLVQNSLVEVTKGELIDGGNDFSLTTTDVGANEIKVIIEQETGFLNEAILQDEAVQLLHCKFSVADPSLLSQLEGEDFELEGNVWYKCRGRLTPFDKISFKADIHGVSGFGTASIDYHLQKFAFRTQGSLQILNFDIYASSSESWPLNTAELYINYGSTAFGTFLESNNLASFNGATGYMSSISDEGANTIKIELTEAFPNTPPLTVGSEPVRIGTVTLIAQVCNSPANISWNDLTNNLNHTYQEDGENSVYANVTYSGGLESPLCGCNQSDAPEITGFSANQVRAGVGERLTIFGNNFGEVIVRGSCYIEVENADHSFPATQQNPGWNDTDRTRIPLDDIIDWRNDAITFIVPSTTLGSFSAPMESGKVIVFNECGESNDENMDVEYAVANIRQSGRAYRVALEKQTENGINFTYSTNVGTQERTLTEYAVKTWCNTTNIGWSVGGSTSSSQVRPDDNINIVVEVNPATSVFLGGAFAGVVRAGEIDDEVYIESCTNNNDQPTYYVRNIDLLINQNINFGNPDIIPWARAEAIFLHELGHAHLLEHAAVVFGSGQTQKLMYYTSAVFNYNITSADNNGATSVFEASQSLLSGGDCPSPIEASGCPNSVNDLSIQGQIVIRPNPFQSEFVLDVESPLPSNTSITVYSITGQVLFRKIFEQGEQIAVSGLDFIRSGIYIVKIQNQEGDWSGRIIKMQ